MIPQLRVRTEHSFRKAFGPIKRVVERLAEIDAPAAGIVDDATWGHAKWAKTATSPRFGVEVAIPRGEGLRPISWVLGREMRGFYRFSSAVLRESADPEQLLREYAPSLVRFAGAALEDPDLFDYVDINPASPLRQRAAIALAKRTGKPLVATSSAFYPGPTDEGAFLAIGGRETPSPQFLMGEVELRAALPAFSDGEWSKIRANTFEASEAAASKLNKAGLIKVEGDLRALAAQGKAERLASGRLKAWTEVEEARLARELDLIESKDFSSYFLVVADLIRWSKTKMLVGPGRGSSSGSLLCFLIGITEVNPLDHGLLFERFVDLTRSDLPDIDIDFDDSKRELAFEYLSEKYGRDNVARIGSINTLKPRSAMFEACKRLAIPNKDRFDVINVLLEYSSGDARYGHGIEDTFANTEPGRKFLENYPAAEVVTKIENHAWHAGVHAAGVIVSNEPVIDFCTVTPEGIAQTDKKGAEQLNLLKIDALGLRTLGVLSDAGISQETLYNLPLDDPKVFEVFNQRRFCDIFQFEGAAMRSVSARVPITSLRSLDHITAIARPGPLVGGSAGHYIDRANGREEPTPPHPFAAESVADTFGVIIYQEQVMNIAKEVGGFSWEGVTFLRKAMSGRMGAEFFDQQGENFLAGATERGMTKEDATALWKSICTFGSWSMNRAHTASYAMISYWCAWAKAYKPLEFAAASLRRAKGDEHAFSILRELAGEGIGYIAFDAEKSQADWAAVDGKIVGGFTSLKGIGPAKAKTLIEKREKGNLTPEDLAKYLPSKFENLYPIRSKYAAMINDPFKHGCREGSVISPCAEMPEEGEVLLIGKMFKKTMRDKNEAILRAKRDGAYWKNKQSLFLDFWIIDDSGTPILCRIDPWRFEEIGRPFYEESEVDETEVLVRGKRIPNFSMLSIIKVRILNRKDKEAADATN